jgi:IstB-like ATP binding protein
MVEPSSRHPTIPPACAKAFRDAVWRYSHWLAEYDAGSLLITSQVPIDHWHDIVGNPTLADAILDRVIHNAYRIDLAGESMRKRRMLELSA